MMGKSVVAPAVATALLFGLLVAYSTSSSDSRSELMQLDGIELDPNAVSKLTGGDGASQTPSYVHLSHESGNRINKLLKKDEKGEIDGIALDSRAEAELGDSHMSARHSHSERSSHSKKKRVSRAQTLLDEGKEDLDSSNWQDAVKLFAKAEAIWKRNGNQDYHWASSLKNDVLRAHPELAAQKPGSPSMSEHQLEVKNAEKQLSSGHAFRSLYGLLRERQAAKMGAPPHMQSSSPSSLRPASAQTASLSQTSPHSNSITQRIDSATQSAIQTLEQQNQALLKKEEAAILYKAEEEKRRALARQQHRAHRHQVRLAAAAKAPSSAGTALSFRSAGPGAGGAELAQGREEQLAEVPRSMRAGVMQQEQQQQQQQQQQYGGMAMQQQRPALYQYPQQQRVAEYQYPQQGAVAYESPQGYQQGAVQQSLAATAGPAKAEGQQAVPVINLNLPPGQTVPAGQYEMDGNLVEDLAGHWDFVGNLEPEGPAIVPQ